MNRTIDLATLRDMVSVKTAPIEKRLSLLREQLAIRQNEAHKILNAITVLERQRTTTDEA